MKRSLLPFALCVLSALSSRADAASADAALQFRISEGYVLNAFYQRGPNAAHLLLSDGTKPRVLVAFPAGNSGVGAWFEPSASPVRWTLGDTRPVDRPDAQGRTLHGISVDAIADAQRLVVRDAVLGSVRILRDFQLGLPYPPDTAANARVSGRTVTWSRTRLDGAAGYLLSMEIVDGRITGGDGAPVTLEPARAGRPIRLRIVALTGEAPLTPIAPEHLLDANAADDPAARNALRFLSYKEKFLAGSWRFDTYFGRDTLMSIRLLMPALQPDAIEAGLSSVLDRLNAAGEVAHEEDIGEFAVLRHRKQNERGDASVYDYGMIDDDVMLAPVVAAYLLDRPEGRARAAAFLARKTAAGEPLGSALARNFAFVAQEADAFAREPAARHLVALKDGRNTGQWRDSEDGLAHGRYAYDVNAVFVPAALSAIARISQAGLLKPHATPAQRARFANAGAQAKVWSRKAPPLFRVSLSANEAKRAVSRYAQRERIDPAAALAALPAGPLRFDALSLDARGAPIPVLHSDPGFALLFDDLPPATVDAIVETALRPFPAGLLTDIGLLVANPAFAGSDVQDKFGRTAYHGSVVWSWQQALFAAGLQRQLARDDLPAAIRTRLRDGQARLWQAIDATRRLRSSELWSWSYADGRYGMAPFGQSSGDADESNAAQLWSTVYLAIPPPPTPASSQSPAKATP